MFAGQALVAFARPNASGRWRVGVTTSRRVRGAVQRNRLRRRLREAARAELLRQEPCGDGRSYDVVLIGRPAAADLPQALLERETAAIRTSLVGTRS